MESHPPPSIDCKEGSPVSQSLNADLDGQVLDCLIQARSSLAQLAERLQHHLTTGRTPVAQDIGEHVAELNDLLTDISASLIRVQVGANGGARVSL
jgi:hypothetical protein